MLMRTFVSEFDWRELCPHAAPRPAVWGVAQLGVSVFPISFFLYCRVCVCAVTLFCGMCVITVFFGICMITVFFGICMITVFFWHVCGSYGIFGMCVVTAFCGLCVITAFFGMRVVPTIFCSMCVVTAFFGMCVATVLCGMRVAVACVWLWHACSYGALWHACGCGLRVAVACVWLWHAGVADVLTIAGMRGMWLESGCRGVGGRGRGGHLIIPT